AWICRRCDFRSRVPSGHVGTAAFGRPDATLVSDPWRSTIWSTTDHRPVLLGRHLGCGVWTGVAQAAGISDVVPWTGTWHRGGIGRSFHRSIKHGFAGVTRFGCYCVCALIPNQRMLGIWRRPDLAIADAAGSIQAGLHFPAMTGAAAGRRGP